MKELDEMDFPAAHSMDTSWFGIDDEGNIAEFTSGEAGAMPVKAVLNSNNWHPGALMIYLQSVTKRCLATIMAIVQFTRL
jgi:hypothetical protein